uniref:DUF642 domain-containing protein n=1 Tax=Oryza rufipogon TaxID=4529 RepID=A0A0E0N2M2_ORYRU
MLTADARSGCSGGCEEWFEAAVDAMRREDASGTTLCASSIPGWTINGTVELISAGQHQGGMILIVPQGILQSFSPSVL